MIGITRFLVFDIIGGVAWSLTYVSIGYLFGKKFAEAAKFIGPLILAGVVLSGVILYFPKAGKKTSPLRPLIGDPPMGG